MQTEFVEQQVTIQELEALYASGEYDIEIDSPDGWTEVTNVFFSGNKPILRVEAASGSWVAVSETHPVETKESGFIQAQDLRIGQHTLITPSGYSPLVSAVSEPAADTYDLTVAHENHRFWAQGLSVHNCYGGSAWTVANNMNSSVDTAQMRIDNFFRKLTTLAAYMTATRQAVKRVGYVVNLFGRVRDVSQWAWSKAPSEKERRKDAGYAERTGLNHPIQSSAAEILKVGAIRANEYINEEKLNPIGGLFPPLKFEVLPTYRDFKAFMASSVHDEMMYLLRDDSFDEVIPMLYIKMQLTDVLAAFGMPFQLEMDCEYDTTRSWTASEKFHTAKIYLLARIAGLLEGTVNAPTQGGKPNAIIIDFESVTPPFLEALGRYLETAAAPEEPSPIELYDLGVNQGDQLYLHGSKFPRDLIESLSVKYRMAVITAKQ